MDQEEQVIEIRRLRVKTFIGVPDAERAEPQELLVTVKIRPRLAFAEMADEIEKTVDYAALAEGIKALGLEKARRLIETLANDVAEYVLTDSKVAGVEVMVEKFILPDTECVAVRVRR